MKSSGGKSVNEDVDEDHDANVPKASAPKAATAATKDDDDDDDDDDAKPKSKVQVPWKIVQDLAILTNCKLLAAGMIFHREMQNTNPDYGQHHRDRTRLLQLQNMYRYEIDTIDDKHLAEHAEPGVAHFNVNFYNQSDLLGHLVKRYKTNYYNKYDIIILDYNFMPGNSYQENLKTFLTHFIPTVIESGVLKSNGCVFLPTWNVFKDIFKQIELSPLYSTTLVCTTLMLPYII